MAARFESEKRIYIHDTRTKDTNTRHQQTVESIPRTRTQVLGTTLLTIDLLININVLSLFIKN